MKTAIEILKDYLQANGYDGLAYPFTDCGCRVCELQPCGEDFSNCVPAYEGEGDDGGWGMYVSKEEAEASKR